MKVLAGAEVRPDMKWRAVGIFGKWIIDGIFATSRIRYVDPYGSKSLMDTRRIIAAFWHSRILLVSYLFKGWGGAIMVSRSEDGEIIAQVLKQQGQRPVRGSSRKGGARALARMAEVLSTETRASAIIPDGPQGPRGIVQPGIIALARKTGYPIVPITYGARHIKVFNSWDRFILPRPGTECAMAYGRPFVIPRKLPPAVFEEKRLALERELHKITRMVDSHYGHNLT